MQAKITHALPDLTGMSPSNESNLVPRARVSFDQHQDTELWNNQFSECKILEDPASGACMPWFT